MYEDMDGDGDFEQEDIEWMEDEAIGALQWEYNQRHLPRFYRPTPEEEERGCMVALVVFLSTILCTLIGVLLLK